MKLLLKILFLLLTSVLDTYSQATGFGLVNTKNLDTALSESSGLEYCRGKLWTHNDSGGEPKIYAIDPATGAIKQTITIQGVSYVDWEDLAADGYYLYIADTGNNVDGSRTNLCIYKINLDDIPATGDADIPLEKVQVICFYYPEQGESPTLAPVNNTPYDCEAILVRNNVIHIFTKDWTSAGSGYGTSEYLLPTLPHPEGNKYPATFFKRHNNINFLVSGADNAGINQVVLIGYQSQNIGDHYVRIYSGFKGDDISTGAVFSKNIGNPMSLGQVEAICFGEDPFTGYISNEKFSKSIINYGAKLKSFSISYKAAEKLAITTGTAGSGFQGTIRYNLERNHLEGFDGLNWIPIDVK